MRIVFHSSQTHRTCPAVIARVSFASCTVLTSAQMLLSLSMHGICCLLIKGRSPANACIAGHVTKMAVTPCYPPYQKTPCCMQTSRLSLLQNRRYCPLKFYAAEMKNSVLSAAVTLAFTLRFSCWQLQRIFHLLQQMASLIMTSVIWWCVFQCFFLVSGMSGIYIQRHVMGNVFLSTFTNISFIF